MSKDKSRAWPKSTQIYVKQALTELEIWRELHPRHAFYVRELAAARIEGREPKHFPPIVIG